MFNIIKKKIIQKIQNNPSNYLLSYKINVAIQLNDYFTKKKWLDKIDKFIKLKQNINFVFIKNKIQLIRNLNYFDAGFFFDLSDSYIQPETKIKMIYISISGLQFNLNKFNNIKLYTSKGISSNAIADYVLSMAILIVNGYNQCIENKAFRKWEQTPVLSQNFKRIEDYKIGILGVGNNGKKIAEKFTKLGCKVFGCDKIIDTEFVYVYKWFSENEIEEFCNYIDLLIISIPLNPETKYLINYDFMKKYLKNKYLINVSRGNIINQKDLKKCLNEKIIAGAVLDVFEKEPISIFDSIWNFRNLIITPHISGNINRFVETIQEDFLNKLCSEFNLT